MKKSSYIIFCTIFFVIIMIQFLFLPFSKNKSTENRPLSSFPRLIDKNEINIEFPNEMEAYFQDHFAGRTQLINLYGRLVESVFSQSANSKVILGKNGWMFFHETIGDYEGSAALNEYDMNRLSITLKQIKQILESQGKEFIIVIPPNANSLYGEFMPGTYFRTTYPTNYDRLMSFRELECIDIKKIFSDTDDILYYKTDTHWNGLGSRLAAQAVMQRIESLTGVSAEFDWNGVLPEETLKTGDLALMLFPDNTLLEADASFADTRQRYETVGSYKSPEDMRITTQLSGAPLNVYMLRDSFANSLVPYLSNAYGSVHYTRQMPLMFENEFAYQADVVILEITERRLSELLAAAPEILAHVCEEFDINGALPGLQIFAEPAGDSLRLWGFAPKCVNGLSKVEVMIKSSDSQFYYEAFPVIEQNLAKKTKLNIDSEQTTGAFSLLISALPQETYEIYIRQTGETAAVYSGSIIIPENTIK